MDIVERLRIQQENGIFGLSDEHEFVGWKEAADEIDRLRQALQAIVELKPDEEFGAVPIATAQKIAKDALERKS